MIACVTRGGIIGSGSNTGSSDAGSVSIDSGISKVTYRGDGI